MHILCILLTAYWVILIIRVLSSFFRMPPSGPVRRAMDAVHGLTEPVLKTLRSMLPPLRMGSMGLDLSPIIVFVVIGILRNYTCS